MMPGLYPSFINSSPINRDRRGGNNTSSYLFIKVFHGFEHKRSYSVVIYGLVAVVFTALTAFFMIKYKGGGTLPRFSLFCGVLPDSAKDEKITHISCFCLRRIISQPQAIKSKWACLYYYCTR